MLLKVYSTIAKTTFINTISDPGRFYGFFISHISTALALLIFWRAVFNINPIFRGYTFNQMALYYVAGSLFNKFLASGNAAKAIPEQVNKGLLSYRLLQPVSWNLTTFVRSMVSIIGNSVSGLIAFVVITLYFNIGFFTGYTSILFLIALILGTILSHYIYSTVGLAAFYFPDIWGLRSIFGRFADVAGGKVFPLDILSKNIFLFFTLMPFNYTYFFTMQIYLLKTTFYESVNGILIQFSWCVVTILIYSYLFTKGIKHYESVGI